MFNSNRTLTDRRDAAATVDSAPAKPASIHVTDSRAPKSPPDGTVSPLSSPEPRITRASPRSFFEFDFALAAPSLGKVTEQWRFPFTAPASWRRSSQPSTADVILFPYRIEGLCQSLGLKAFLKLTGAFRVLGEHRARMVWFDTGDTPVDFHIDALRFNASRSYFNRSRCLPMGYPVDCPAWTRDTDGWDDIRYDVGFMGYVGSSPIRMNAIRALATASQLRSDIQPKRRFHGHLTAADAQTERKRYDASLRQSMFILCPRGSGVSSYRLYETLSAGRIPVYVTDDRWLPLEDEISWDDHLVFVPSTELDSIEDRILSWRSRRGTDGLRDTGIRNRDLWRKRFHGDALYFGLIDNAIRRGLHHSNSIVESPPESLDAKEMRIRKELYDHFFSLHGGPCHLNEMDTLMHLRGLIADEKTREQIMVAHEHAKANAARVADEFMAENPASQPTAG